MKRNIKTCYRELSYQKKLKILFHIVILCVVFFAMAIGSFCIRMISREIYERNQEKLSMVTLDIRDELDDVEGIITEIHQNMELQNSLIRSEQSGAGYGSSSLKKELNWLLADKKHVRDLVMLNQNNECLSGNIYNKENYFQNRTLEEITGIIPEGSRQGIWLFEKGLEEGLYIQNIFSTRNNMLKRIGMVLITVNTSFIQEIFDSSGIFTGNDFFVLEQHGEYYSTDLEGYDSYVEFIQKNMEGGSIGTYEFHHVEARNYYVLETNLEVSSTQFHCYYFLLNSQVIRKVIRTTWLFLVIIIAVLIVGNKMTDRYLTKLILPINHLAALMQQFCEKRDFNSLKDIPVPDAALRSNDEVGILYKSFDDLIHQIEELVIHDYKSKLLNQEMEYKFLQAQLNPHFLYNTLNSMNFMALKSGNAELSEIITSLAFLLRTKLSGEKQYESVREEMEVVLAYIRIQKLRYKSRLEFETKIQEETMECRIPQLIIQPLIENAVKYGVEKVSHPIRVCLEIYAGDGELYIKVADNGPGVEKSAGNAAKYSTGLGLKNIQKRLEVLYGEKAGLSVDSVPDSRTTVIIRLPEHPMKRAGTGGWDETL